VQAAGGRSGMVKPSDPRTYFVWKVHDRGASSVMRMILLIAALVHSGFSSSVLHRWCSDMVSKVPL